MAPAAEVAQALHRIVDRRCQAIVDVLTPEEKVEILRRVENLCKACILGDSCPVHASIQSINGTRQ